MAIDLRVVEPDQFGNLLQHFTGSKAHNMALREAAVRRGLHVSEYGILDDATGETHRCATEEEVYERLGLPWIPPELREDRGELAGRRRALPRAHRAGRPQGRPAHAHHRLATARNTIEEMAARRASAATSTSRSPTTRRRHGFGNHVSPDELRRQIERVRALDERAGRHRAC